MKIRPQSELAHVQGRTLALNQAEAVSRGRFDTALLQAAQGVRDVEGDAYSGLTPQARQALSEALEDLSGKSLSQLKDLARQPEALAALIAGLSQGTSLSSAESARLVKLLTMALPRILQAKSKGDSESSTDTASGAKSSPVSRDFFSFLAGQGAASGPESEVSAQGEAAGHGASLASVADALSGANNGLAGIQGGQAYGSTSGNAAGAVVAPFSFAGDAPGGATSGSGLAGVQAGQGYGSAFGSSGAPGVSGPVYTVATGVAGAVQAQGQAAAQNVSGSPAPAGNASGGQASGNGVAKGLQADSTGAEFPLMLDLDVQFVDPSAPLGVQPGSQVTLKGDGAWIYPVSAQAQAPKPQGPQAQRVQAQEDPATSVQEPQQVASRDGVSPEPGLPVFGQTVAGNGIAETSLEATDQNGRPGPVGGGAAQASDALQALVEDPLQAGLGDGTVSQGSGPKGQVGVFGQSGGASQGPSQVQASAQILGQAPLAPVPQGGSDAPAGQGGEDGASGSARGSSGRGGLSGAATSAPSNFGAALAAVGQNAGQGGQAGPGQGAWPEGSAVPAGLAQVVTQALTQTGSSAPSRLVIQLSPSNLGAVQVDLSLVDGKLTARLVAGQSDVRDALARDLSGFKAGLESHGVVVNEVSVALGSNLGSGQDAPRQAPQEPWRAFATTASREAADTAVSAGWGAYGANAAGDSQGFSALA